MTTVERFQAVAAVGAAAATLAVLVPGLGGRAATSRHAGGLAAAVASWLLLVGSLVSRSDLSTLRDRLDSPARAAAAAIGVLLVLAVSVVVVRQCVRRPAVWLVLLAIALPIRVPISLGGDRSGNLLLPLYWVIGVGIAALVWGAATGRIRPRWDRGTAIDIPLAAFTAFTLVSTTWSGDIHEATIKAVFFYLPFVLLYRVVVWWWDLVPDPVPALARTTMIMAAAVAVIAVGQYATRTIWWNDTLEQGNVYNRFFRANGIFYDPNILGRYLMLALVLAAVHALLTRPHRYLAVLGVAAAVTGAGLVVTFSRSSALGLMVAMALIAGRAFGIRRTLLVGAAALVLVGAPAVAVNQHVRDKVTSLDKLVGSGEGRFRLVRGGIDLWKSEPIKGVGLGAFSARYREAQPPRRRDRTRVFISHTAPVTILAELGAIGFGLFLALCIATVAAMWRSARAARPEGWVQWTALTGLIAIFVHALLYSALFEDPFVWVLLGVGLAAGRAVALSATETGGTAPMPVPAPTAEA